jgi:hypothetical protein
MAIEETKKSSIKGSTCDAEVRLLLVIWDEKEIKKVDLNKRIVRTGEKASDYQKIVLDLVEKGAIADDKKLFSLTEKGLNQLKTNLLNLELNIAVTASEDKPAEPARPFDFTNNYFTLDKKTGKTDKKVQQIGAKFGDVLLKWIREQGSNLKPVPTIAKISSFDEFKTVALEVYDRLNRDYNFDNFVPIYRIRREIGDRITRQEFSDWLIKMQADDILLLQESGVEDSARDKLEDSVNTPISGLRCYATKKVK